MLIVHSEQRLCGNIGIVQQVGTVAGNEYLAMPRALSEGRKENACRPGVKGHFGLLKSDQRGRRSPRTSWGSLEHRQKDSERAESPIRHGSSEKAPWMLLALDLLPEFDGLLRAQGLCLRV